MNPPMPTTDKGEQPTKESKAFTLTKEWGEIRVVREEHYIELERQLTEAKDRLTAQMLFGQLGGRLITKIFEHADMTLPDSTDAELQLVRMLNDLATLRRQSAALQERVGELEAELKVAESFHRVAVSERNLAILRAETAEREKSPQAKS